ncbi:FrgA protein [Aggregicoccus sp. 17bor-14]|uniref:GspE/PulE/PilB domain-containing protein n=1 Tax=Myxococcaceae TaxID=31 RepID=UPI00129C4419|nr:MULTISPECIES: FrgA protein [Myxococcaceae]MBF5045118.1 FrgA protein [Simulacricoccus sp. 17bor-14]MRI90860.1 FrgA protein [Aggregicoccus sp. 17bor-14]
MPARLAQTLVARGLLPAERAEEAVRRQAAEGGALDTVLLELGVVERGLMDEAGLLQALGEASGYRPVNLADFEPNPDVASFIPPKIAERLCVVPLSLDGNTLHVACGYPVPRKELDEVGFLLGKPLELWVALEVRVREWISLIYKQPFLPRHARLLAALDPLRAAEAPPLPAPQRTASSPAVPQPSAPSPAARAPEPAAPRPAPEPRAPAAPAPRAASTPEAPRAGATPPGRAPVEERTLEEDLTRDMVERIARQVMEEPIPLEVRKSPRTEAAAPRPTPPPAPAPASPPAPAAVAPPAATPPPPAPDAIPPPAFVRAPLRLNAPAPQQPPAPSAPPAPTAEPIPPPAFVREPLRLNAPRAPEPARPPVAAPRPADPQFLVFSDPAPAAPAPAAPPAAAAPPRAATSAAASSSAGSAPGSAPGSADVPDWTLAQARAALKDASRDRGRLIDTALRYGRRTFEYVAAFAVIRGAAVGWEARGEGADALALSQVSVPLDAASVFRTVAVTRGSYAGPLPPDALSRHYLELFGRVSPRTVCLYPVEVRGRLVCVLYGDAGSKPVSQRRLSDFTLFCQELGAAFQELILHRKQRLGEVRAHALNVPEDATPSAPVATPALFAGLGWGPTGAGSGSGMGRAASLSPRIQSESERPPPDFSPLLARLVGPDAAQRSRAMAELARTPEASAKVLAGSFPGPTAWSRLPVLELPHADELGPIPGALSRLGRPAALALAPLLDANDADARYLALLTAGSLPFAELVPGVLRGLFDLEPDISSAARVAATALKRLPRFDAAMKDLRQELAARDPLRRSLAARALGSLHDRESIEGLINLTGSDDEMCAQAAAEALREVTRATFGLQPRQWTAWWAENRTRRRADWLVAALRHRELDVRLAAFEELSRALNDSLGYLADGSEPEREAAVRRWEAALQDPQRARRLAVL